jgi:phage shock protein A
MNRVTVEQAAHILGIKEESVRKRVSRGKLRSDKDEDGRLLVYVDGTGTVRDEYGDRSVTDGDEQPDLARELIEEMRSRISSLENQLSEERESRRRADTIIAQLTQANAALAARVPELEAAESHEEPAEATPTPAPGQGTTGAQNGSERVSWWRRMLGE